MNSYFGGIPTDIDVRAIREHWPDESLKVGEVIKHDDMEAILKCGRKSCRYKTVTARWRKLVENSTNKIIGAKRGEGFVVLSEREKVGLSGDKLRSAGRLARRSYIVAGRIDVKELSDDQRKELDFVNRKTAAVLTAAKLRPTADLPSLD